MLKTDVATPGEMTLKSNYTKITETLSIIFLSGTETFVAGNGTESQLLCVESDFRGR
jgi:hypothetical protein